MYVENNLYEAIRSDGYSLAIPGIEKQEKPLLICYFSSMSCGGCVSYAISKLEEVFPDMDNSPVYFVACNYNQKTRFNQKNTILWNRRKDVLSVDETNSVCYFILLDGIVHHLFIPEKKYKNYTDIYLSEIRKRYF